MAGLGWGWFEAGWVRLRVLEVAIPGLPAELDGLRIAHLSDFHLGPPSRGTHAVERAVEWVAERQPDLVCLTGDLVTRTRGQKLFDELLAHPGAPYPEGVFTRDATTMHVSPGLGTTFVPFRYFARPEATELVLRSA